MKKLFLPASLLLASAYLLPFGAGLSSCKKEVTVTVHDTLIQKDTVIRKDTVYQNPPANPNIRLANGLLAYYPFSGNAGDSSGNGNHGTLFNGAVIAADERGNAASALSVTGSNGVIVTDGGKLNPVDTMTICFDVMVRTPGRQCFITRVNFLTGVAPGFHIGTNTPGDQRLQFTALHSGSPCDRWTTVADNAGTLFGNTLEREAWYTVIVSFKSGQFKMYVNGKLISQFTSSFTKMSYCTNANFLIGSWWTGDYAGLNGKLDNVRMYNRTLNADEIAYLSRWR